MCDYVGAAIEISVLVLAVISLSVSMPVLLTLLSVPLATPMLVLLSVSVCVCARVCARARVNISFDVGLLAHLPASAMQRRVGGRARASSRLSLNDNAAAVSTSGATLGAVCFTFCVLGCRDKNEEGTLGACCVR